MLPFSDPSTFSAILSDSKALEIVNETTKRQFSNIKRIENGCNSICFCLDDQYIARFAANEYSYRKLKNEKAILDFLEGQSTIKIPEPIMYKSDPAFLLHKMVEGENLSSDMFLTLNTEKKHKFASDIIDFVSFMHSFSLDDVKSLNLKYWNRYESFLSPKKLFETIEKLDTKLKPAELEYLRGLCERYEIITQENADLVFGHCDIMVKNIAFNTESNTLNGLYDFGDSGLVHREFEFSQMMMDWPSEFLPLALNAYFEKTDIKVDQGKVMDHMLYCRASFYSSRLLEAEEKRISGSSKLLKVAIKRHQGLD